jgi:hypothetical protein
MSRHLVSPALLTAQQIVLYMFKPRAGSRQEKAAASVGISVSSAHLIDSGLLQPKPTKPHTRLRPGLLAEVCEPLPSPDAHHFAGAPARAKGRSGLKFIEMKLQRRMQHWKALHGPVPEVMLPLAASLSSNTFQIAVTQRFTMSNLILLATVDILLCRDLIDQCVELTLECL